LRAGVHSQHPNGETSRRKGECKLAKELNLDHDRDFLPLVGDFTPGEVISPSDLARRSAAAIAWGFGTTSLGSLGQITSTNAGEWAGSGVRSSTRNTSSLVILPMGSGNGGPLI
jgi:hypothetical protein